MFVVRCLHSGSKCRSIRPQAVANKRHLEDLMNVATVLKSKGRNVVTIHAGVTLKEIAEELSSRKIGVVIVTGEAGRVIGILSERDVVRHVASKGAAALEMTAGEVMTKNVITCQETHTLDELMETMTAGRFRHMPVVEGGQLVGLISIGDVVKYHLADMALEVSAMRSYLTTG